MIRGSNELTSGRRDGKQNFKIIFFKNHKNFKLEEIRNTFIFKIKTIWIHLQASLILKDSYFPTLLNSLLLRYYIIYDVWWNVVIEH